MILDPQLTKAIADLDAAAKRLQRATAPNLCIDCAEPCGYIGERCAHCQVRHNRAILLDRIRIYCGTCGAYLEPNGSCKYCKACDGWERLRSRRPAHDA